MGLGYASTQLNLCKQVARQRYPEFKAESAIGRFC